MGDHYEPDNPLSMPFECFEYDSAVSPFPIEEHWHYFAETIMVISGLALVRLGPESYTVQPGDVLFIGPLQHHSVESADGKPVHYAVVKTDPDQMNETPSYAPTLRAMMLEAEEKKLPVHFCAEDIHNAHMDYMIRQCVLEYREREFGYDLKIRALLYLLFTALIRLWLRSGYTLQTHHDLADPLYSITSYIENHIRESLKVEELARHCGLSYPWFAKRFREIYSISCKEYIEKVRISKVEHYLVFTDYDLSYISRETGYADCSHMIKDFRRLKQTTPGQYRLDRKKDLPHP